jgi:hypothetical protein
MAGENSPSGDASLRRDAPEMLRDVVSPVNSGAVTTATVRPYIADSLGEVMTYELPIFEELNVPLKIKDD